MLDFFGAVFSPRKSGNNKNALSFAFRNLDIFLDTLKALEKPFRVLYHDNQCTKLSRYQYLLSFQGELRHV